jgi:hypothetical protein
MLDIVMCLEERIASVKFDQDAADAEHVARV